MKKIALVPALFAAVLGLATPASAEPTHSFTMAAARADLNGDGTLDVVTARPAPDNPNKQILTAIVDGQRYTESVPMDYVFGVQPLRVGDVNGDGRDEIFVNEVIGANTSWFTVWGLNERWFPVRYPDGTEMYLYEGGGISSVEGYGCEVVDGQRQLYRVSAYIEDWDALIYDGDKINYVVENGVATEVSRQHVNGPRDAFPADHATCA